VGDFDGDGLSDIAVVNRETIDISVLRNEGSFMFRSLPPIPIDDGSVPAAITSGDFNGDGLLDLAVACANSDNVSILLNQGDATFHAASTMSVRRQPSAMVAAWLNGDEHLDLAVTNSTSGQVSVLINDGHGVFVLDRNYPEEASYAQPTSLTAADLNHDSHIDLAVANSQTDEVTVLTNDGGGNFSITDYVVGARKGTFAVVAGDFNDDGNVDLATANRISHDVSILWNDGTGHFALHDISFPIDFKPSALAAGDLDRDGDIDLAVSDGNSDLQRPEANISSLSVLLNNGSGRFDVTRQLEGTTSFITGLSDRLPSSLVLSDLDSDGVLDLVATGGLDSNTVSVLHTRLDRGGDYFVTLRHDEEVEGYDFGIQPKQPRLDAIDSPIHLAEDDVETMLALTGIRAGAGDGSTLAIDVSSSNRGLLLVAVEHTPPDSIATLRLTPQPDQFGRATISVTVTDAGLDDIPGTDDDGTAAMSLEVNIEARNDPPTAIDDEFIVRMDSVDNVLDVLANDTAAPDVGETLTIREVYLCANARVSGNGRHVIYTPLTGILGEYGFVYVMSDGADEEAALATIVVTKAGDANGDFRFDQFDLITVLKSRKYRTGAPATWAEGDWNADGVFDQLDMIEAMKTAKYLNGPFAAY
jgi:hypothetical protein